MQPKFQRKKDSSEVFFCQIKRETPLPPEWLPSFFTFPLSRGYAFPPFRRPAAAGERGPPGTGDVRHDMACALPPPGGGGKRGRDTKVSLPLLTPQPFLRTRLPPVARLNARGHRGVWCFKIQHLMEAELFAEQDERSAPSGRALTALQITQGKFRA